MKISKATERQKIIILICLHQTFKISRFQYIWNVFLHWIFFISIRVLLKEKSIKKKIFTAVCICWLLSWKSMSANNHPNIENYGHKSNELTRFYHSYKRDLFRVRYMMIVLYWLFLFLVSIDIAILLIFHLKMQKNLGKFVKFNYLL